MKPAPIAVLACFLALATSCSVVPSPDASTGFLDASAWDFRQGRLPLKGEWSFYEGVLAAPTPQVGNTYRAFPEIWNTGKLGENTINYATYQLRVKVNAHDSLALAVPQIYCSYRLWVNQQLVSENGTPGTTKRTTQPQWLPRTVHFPVTADTLLITLQIANFYHYKGGIRENIYLGSIELLDQHRSLAATSMWIESVVLASLGVLFLGLFVFKRRSVILYFSLVCLVWSVRALFSNLYLIIDRYPDLNWFLMIRVEYLTIYVTMVLMLLYVLKLFPKESVKVLFFLLLGANICFIIPTLVAEPLVFTRYLPVYLFTAGCTILLGAATVLLAWVNDRPGTTFMLLAVFMTAALFSYDILAYEGMFLFNELVISAGYVVVFLFLCLALMAKLNIFNRPTQGDTLTYEQMFPK